MSYPKNLAELYSGADLDTLFKGNFINFGYWENAPKNTISIEDMIEANQQLYQQTFQRLALSKHDSVLELGSGHGAGCMLLSNAYPSLRVLGLEYLASHVSHSKKNYAPLLKGNKTQFLQGKAEAIPLSDNSINKVYTVEAFQHFNPKSVIPELARVLSPGGKLVITTFFTPDKTYFPELLTLLPKPAILSDNGDETFAALPEILDLLKDYSFQNIGVENISPYIWSGYNRWVHQNDPGIWDRNWLLAHEKKLIDYYIITADFYR